MGMHEQNLFQAGRRLCLSANERSRAVMSERFREAVMPICCKDLPVTWMPA